MGKLPSGCDNNRGRRNKKLGNLLPSSSPKDAFDEYLYWQTQDRKTLKKINALLKCIQRDPFTGDGKPEPLKGELTGLSSRRINDKDRLVYQVSGQKITIFQCKGHYGDQ